ncbi:APC family permease [Rhodococcus fascians]|nr:APC family permease [Rhodococcus fascians]MBY4140906.1 APC family permease [Rhodococcus fascians]MBY4219570.1 APC family permease [Rhodococcus fascians]MBY4221879.1 APC family permease [Rhodococcus fascians]MBY4233880.1 APC family permease [Rhodococcus fascians]
MTIPKHSGHPNALDRASLNSRDIVFFVVAAAAPLTVMVAVAPIALLVGGIGAPAGYLCAGLINMVFAIGFTKMARHVRNNGAFYSYIRKGLGKVVGLGSAMVAVVCYTLLQLSIYGLLGAVTQATVNDFFGLDLPWWVWALVAGAVVSILGYRSIRIGAKVLGVLLVLEVLVLLVLSVGVIAKGGATGLNLQPFAPENVFTGSMGAVLAIAFAAFIGFEATALFRNEAVRPDRTVPRATYAAVIFLALFYCFIVWIAVMAFGVDNAVPVAAADPAGFFFTAMQNYVGTAATDVMRVLIVTSGLAALLAIHNAITRYGYALGRERIFPARLSFVHRTHLSPHVASVAQSVIAAVAVICFAVSSVDPILQMAAWTASTGTVGILSLQWLTSLSVAVFFLRGKDVARDRVTAASGIVAFILIGIALYLVIDHIDLATLTTDPVVNTIAYGAPLAVFILGAVLALWIRTRRPAVYAGLGTTEIDSDLTVSDQVATDDSSSATTPVADKT